jgi:hypothetical protein
MRPGVACVACHVDSNATSGKSDAPVFLVAGTVYPSLHEPDFCEGTSAAGAEVVVTDALARTLVAPVNDAGNFFLVHPDDDPAPLLPPFEARIRFHDREQVVVHESADGDCNRCHSAAGAEDAPGRITLPPP